MKITIPDNSNEGFVLLFSKRGNSAPFTIHCYEITPDQPDTANPKPVPSAPNPHNGNGAHIAPLQQAGPFTQHANPAALPPLGRLMEFMRARNISEASMLDYLKEEGRIADFVTRLCEVPDPVLEDVVSSWVEMMEEEGTI